MFFHHHTWACVFTTCGEKFFRLAPNFNSRNEWRMRERDFHCFSAGLPELRNWKLTEKIHNSLRKGVEIECLTVFITKITRKKNLFDPDLTLISSRIESNLADFVICRFSYCYSKVLINSLGGKRSTRKDLDRSNILIKIFSSKIQDSMKIIKSKWNTKEEKDEREHETSSACKDL